MKYTKLILLLAISFLFTSCYHAQVVTDKNPSSQVIDKPWAHSFIYGLVPPSVIETASECPNGLAKVETKLSFLNGLASSITFGIYTPMHITVTCAAGSGTASMDNQNGEQQITIQKNLSDEKKQDAFSKASKQSLEKGEAIYVAFD